MAPRRNPGVRWNAQKNKWQGRVCDRSVRNGKRSKQVFVGYFADEQACADAVAAKLAEVEASIAQKLHAMAQDLEHTRGLPLRPKHPADAEPDTAYYGEKGYGDKKGEPKEFGPTRVVRMADNSKPGGFTFLPCCRANLDSGAPCTQQAQHDRKHCNRHGGGFRVGEGTGNGVCTHCKTTALWVKRQPQHGGNGLCSVCEAQLKAEADANGYEGPIQSLRWEEQVFNLLLPLLVYADGVTPFPPEQRDERRGGGLGTSSTVKRRRECDTTTNRFPDGQWILRDEHGRAVLVLIVEVDEHSHTDYKPECESGKIHDTNVSVQQKLGFEGAATGARAPKRPMVPLIIIKMNPNAYDGPRTKLETRVQAVADLFHRYAHLPAAEREALPTHGPIVHLLYYHSKEGAQNLAHLREVGPKAGWTLTVH